MGVRRFFRDHVDPGLRKEPGDRTPDTGRAKQSELSCSGGTGGNVASRSSVRGAEGAKGVVIHEHLVTCVP